MKTQLHENDGRLTPVVSSTLSKVGVTLFLLSIIALSWSRYLDDAAQIATTGHFKKALAAAAIARGFNGIISVAQGTEIAIAPVGVGVTLSIGEILDPLNDLVERFSALALVASVALGVQLSLGQILSSPWVSAGLSVAGLLYLTLLWRAPTGKFYARTQPVMHWLTKGLALLVFLRFMLVCTLLFTDLIDTQFLAKQQDQALAELTQASQTIEQIQNQTQIDTMPNEEADLFDRTAAQLQNFLDTSRHTLDLQAQLAKVKQQAENSIEEMVNLIVIFFLQTLLLPIASLWLSWRGLSAFWMRTRQHP